MRALQLPVAYALLSGVWILVSDQLAEIVAHHLGLENWVVNTAKGWGFVLVSAALLYLWLRRFITNAERLSAIEENQQLLEKLVQERTVELTTLIAEHKRTEEDLAQKRVLLRSLLYSIPDLVFFKDRNFVYLGGNPAFEEFVGLKEAEFVGHTDFDLFSLDLARLFRSMDEAMFVEGRARRNEEWVTYPDGRRPLLETYKAPFYGPSGEVMGLIGIARDITERHTAAQALAASEHRFRRLVEQTNVIAWELDLSTWRFTYVSPHAVKLLGYQTEEWYAEGFWADHIHPDDRDFAVRYCTDSTMRGEDHQFEYRFLNVRGEVVWLRDVVSVQFESETPVGLRGVMIDITASKKAEAELVQTSKLSLLGELAAGVAHELNQPLNIIRLTAESALMDIEDSQLDMVGVEERLRRVSEQSERMGKIINHLRILSRRNEDVVEVFDLRDPVMASVELVQRQFAAQNIRLTVRGSKSQPFPVRGSHSRLEQVILNLLTNARDAILARKGEVEGGSVTVSWNADGSGKTARIVVVDTGGGIDEKQLGKIFDPFYTTKPAGVGTGLGLSISQSIVNGMGGRLEARNRGAGAMFVVTLPLCDDQTTPLVQQSMPAAVTPPGFACQHILIVDDESAAVATLSDFFRRRGYRVSAASDGEQAWEIVGQDPCNLVVTDLRMQGTDGLTLIRRLEEYDPTLPVLLVTGELEIENLTQLRPLPPNLRGVFHKPLNLSALAATVDDLMKAAQVQRDTAL